MHRDYLRHALTRTSFFKPGSLGYSLGSLKHLSSPPPLLSRGSLQSPLHGLQQNSLVLCPICCGRGAVLGLVATCQGCSTTRPPGPTSATVSYLVSSNRPAALEPGLDTIPMTDNQPCVSRETLDRTLTLKDRWKMSGWDTSRCCSLRASSTAQLIVSWTDRAVSSASVTIERPWPHAVR